MNQFNDYNVPPPPKFATFKECDTYADMLPFAVGIQQKAFLVRNDETNAGLQTAYIYDGQDTLTSLSRIIAVDPSSPSIDTNLFTGNLTLAAARHHELQDFVFQLKGDLGYTVFIRNDIEKIAYLFVDAARAIMLGASSIDHALVSFYTRSLISAGSDPTETALLASHYPFTGDPLIPAPAIDINLTAFFKASQVDAFGHAEIYAKTVFLNTGILKINTARIPTGAGYVLTDVAGNGVLTLAAAAGGGGIEEFRSDEVYNLAYGTGTAAQPVLGNTIFLGVNAGQAAITADDSNFIGFSAGNGANGSSSSNFIGSTAGMNAPNSYRSNFIGQSAGFGTSNGDQSNFIGWNAGSEADNAKQSNFIGVNAGQNAVWSLLSNFIGYNAGYAALNCYYSNFIGASAGNGSTYTENANFLGQNAGKGCNTANYSTFIGYNTGNAATHVITGKNNVLIGTNITTPTAATANTLNIGNVLYGKNLHANDIGNPSITPQTTGQIGINTVPDASAALDINSTTRGILPPRMTTAQKTAINASAPAAGTMVYDTTLNQMSYYNGTGWVNF